MKRIIIRIFLITTISLFIVIWHTASSAETIFEDEFLETTRIDTAKTTAKVNNKEGYITLPRKELPNNIAFNSNNEIAVAEGDGVNIYSYDEATNKLVKNTSLAITDIDDPIGIACSTGDYSMWVLTENEIRRYDYTESGMSHNPYLSVTGLKDVFSISSSTISGTVVTLSKDSDGKGKVSTYTVSDDGKLLGIPQLTFNTGFEDPLSVSMVPNSNDIVVASGDSIQYYSFNDTDGSYLENSMLSVIVGEPMTGLSVKGDTDGYVALTPTNSEYFTYDISIGKMSRVPTLSAQTSSEYNYAIAMRPDKYEYALLGEDGNIEYWMYDDSTGKIVRNSALELASINIKKRYYSPMLYYSTEVATEKEYDEIKIVANENKPEGSKIQWAFSVDGGSNWIDIVNGDWTDSDLHNRFIIRATIETPDSINQDPPKIEYVRLELTKAEITNVECKAITKNHVDQELPTSLFPVKAKQGSQVVFGVNTFGYTTSLTGRTSSGEEITFYPEKDVSEENNTWIGSISFEPDIPEDTVIGITVEGQKGEKKFEEVIENFITINQNVVYDIDLSLIQ